MTKILKAFGKIPLIAYGVLLICLVFSVTAQGFLSSYNIVVLLKDCCLLVTISLGMCMCILLGLVNISVGGIMSLSGVVTAVLLHSGIHMLIAILGGLATGFLFGAICGWMVAYKKFDYWVVSYAFMGITAGLSLIICDGNTIPGFEKDFRFIGDGKIFGVYTMIWITAAIVLAVLYLCNKTKLGYNIYSVGGNAQCAVLSGIDVKKTMLVVYILAGVLAAVSGIMLASKSNSASPIGGSGYEFEAIAAVLIGGVTFEGGRGRVSGTVFGAILMRVLRNGLNLLGASPYWQKVVIGLVVMVVIIIDVIRENKKKEKSLRRVYRVEA